MLDTRWSKYNNTNVSHLVVLMVLKRVAALLLLVLSVAIPYWGSNVSSGAQYHRAVLRFARFTKAPLPALEPDGGGVASESLATVLLDLEGSGQLCLGGSGSAFRPVE